MASGSRRVGGTLGVVLQVVAALAVTAALLGAVELVAAIIVGDDPFKSVQGDYVATTLKVLELAPDLNPAPLVQDPQVLWRNKPLARKTQKVNPEPLGRNEDWTI